MTEATPSPTDPSILTAAELAAISPHAEARVYAAKPVVVTEGDRAGALFVILEGRCKAYVSDAVGVHAVIAIREAGA